MFTLEDIERCISKFRTKGVSIEMGGKVIKEGVITDWKMQDFCFDLILNTEKKDGEVFKILPPFQFEFHGDDFEPELYLDYRIDTLNKKGDFTFEVGDMEFLKSHKFFDNIVSITTTS